VRIEWRARVARAWPQALVHQITAAESSALADDAIRVLTDLGDEAGLSLAWRTAAQAQNVLGNTGGIEEAMRRSLEYARRAGDVRLETEAGFWVCLASVWSASTPNSQARALCEEMLSAAATPTQRANAAMWLGVAYGHEGRYDEARPLLRESRALYAELNPVVYGGSSLAHAALERMAGNLPAAEEVLRDGVRVLEEAGERGYRSSVLAELAYVVGRQSRAEEAWALVRESEELTSDDDVFNIALLESVRATLLAHQGEFEQAIMRAQTGVSGFESVDHPLWLGDALMTLARVLRQAGRIAESRTAAERALALYERKEVVPAIDSTGDFLEQLESEESPRAV
jgi:tetratricopeptide (TPR) repeat protein